MASGSGAIDSWPAHSRSMSSVMMTVLPEPVGDESTTACGRPLSISLRADSISSVSRRHDALDLLARRGAEDGETAVEKSGDPRAVRGRLRAIVCAYRRGNRGFRGVACGTRPPS